MFLDVTDVSLLLIGLLIVLVLLEIRKLGRRAEPVARLEETMERLSRQVERIGVPPSEIELPGGAQIVETGETFETITEQLERLGESVSDLDAEMLGTEGIRRFAAELDQLRADVRRGQELFEGAAKGLGQVSDAVMAAGSALQRVEARLENLVAPSTRRRD